MLNYGLVLKLFKGNPLFKSKAKEDNLNFSNNSSNNNNSNNNNISNNINIKNNRINIYKSSNNNNIINHFKSTNSISLTNFNNSNNNSDLDTLSQSSYQSSNTSESDQDFELEEEQEDLYSNSNSSEEIELTLEELEQHHQQLIQEQEFEEEQDLITYQQYYKLEIEDIINKVKSKIMSTKSYSNYSPNTLIPSVSKTFISQFNLSISPTENNTNKYYNNSKLNNNYKILTSNLNSSNDSNMINNSSSVNGFSFDIFSIPTEMLVHLLSFLSAKDLWNISLTCKRIWYIIDQFKFWDQLFERTCPRIYFAMQFNSRWSSPTPHQAKMILCYIDNLPKNEYYCNFDPSDDNGQIKKVIGVMKEHLNYPSILRETCYILKRLSYRQRKEDEHESLIARYGGIKLILSTMKLHPFDSGVQEDACGALGNLTCDSPNNMGVYSNNNYLEVVEQGGIALILCAMRNHLYNPGVQYNTSFVLRNLARNDVSESRVAQEGGIQAIATAMRNHPNHIGIQTQGCGALRNLGCNDSNKVLSAREGGIGLILKAMRVFSSHPDLQLNGCGALRNLARNEDNKNMISKQGGIQLVLAAMTNHQDDPDVQDEGCAALINLAYQDEANEETIAQEGGINLILKAMKHHPYHSGVQMQGRGALKNLSCNPKNKLIIARSGGIELMNLAIQNHPTYGNRFLELMRILQAAIDNV